MAVTFDDVGVQVHNRRFHYQVTVDGRKWARGDLFYLDNRRGEQRQLSFQYALTDEEDQLLYLVCYNRLHPFTTIDGRRINSGFVTLAPGGVMRLAKFSDAEMLVAAARSTSEALRSAGLSDLWMEEEIIRFIEGLSTDGELRGAIDRSEHQLQNVDEDDDAS